MILLGTVRKSYHNTKHKETPCLLNTSEDILITINHYLKSKLIIVDRVDYLDMSNK